MTIIQDKRVKLSDVTDLPVPLGAEIDVQVEIRLDELHFPSRSDKNLTLVITPYIGGVSTGRKADAIRWAFTKEPTPADPPTDVLNADGTVLVKAGSVRPALPSMSQLRAMVLPNGRTAGELIDAARSAVYVLIQAIDSKMAGREG